MNKFLAIVLSLVMLLSLVACTTAQEDPTTVLTEKPTEAPINPTAKPTEAPSNSGDEYYGDEESAQATWTNAGKEAVLATAELADPFADAIWENAVIMERFMNMNTLEPVDGYTAKVRLLWDENYLYVGYEVFDDTIYDMAATEFVQGTTWWAGDSADVETFLMIDLNETIFTYFANPLGFRFRYLSTAQEGHDGAHFDNTSIDYDTASQIINADGLDQDRWISIQAISFSSLGIAEPMTEDTDLYGTFFIAEYSQIDNKTSGWNGFGVWSVDFMRPIELVGAPTN